MGGGKGSWREIPSRRNLEDKRPLSLCQAASGSRL
jgi:hypothetical protein